MSLHKYLYANANPIYNIDPGGTDAYSIAGKLAVGGLMMVVAGITVQYIGEKVDSPTTAAVGQWMTTGGTIAAGIGMGILFVPAPPLLGAAVGTVPGLIKLAWDRIRSSAAKSAQEVARELSVSKGLAGFLLQIEGRAPLAGRIVQRPGQERWWEVSRLSGSSHRFSDNFIFLQSNDLVYDYEVVGKPADGKMFVTISRLDGTTGQLHRQATYAIENGELAGVDFLRSQGQTPTKQQVLINGK